MKFKVEGKDLPMVEPDQMKLRELAEAEKALGMTMSDGTAGAICVTLFVSMRRSGDDRNPGLVADDVLNSTFANIDVSEEEDAGMGGADPLAVNGGSSVPAPEILPIIGRPPSARSA